MGTAGVYIDYTLLRSLQMKLYNYFLVPVALCLQFASANVEKIIFKGPAPLSIHSEGPSLQNLQLLTINPTNATLRTPIQPMWASEELPAGTTSWFIMHNLTEGQRYELRLCWAATVGEDAVYIELYLTLYSNQPTSSSSGSLSRKSSIMPPSSPPLQSTPNPARSRAPTSATTSSQPPPPPQSRVHNLLPSSA